jgi:osmoprotectant transport system ATP-binding protein
VIEFESVSKTFRDGTAAVVDLSLTVPSDKITVIVGPSGCGKTTTLRMVNRMIEPTSGRILWDGSALRSKRKTTLRRQMGYVIQSGGLFPHRTVVDNVGTVPGLLGWDKNKTQQRSMELLDSVGLDRKLADRYPAQLSGGQQQRVGVARALAADPLVMLMDEPFSAVDPVVRSELHELFLGLQRELSKTIILITHDIDEAIKLGDQVAILRVGGVLAQVGTPQQVLDEPADAFVEGFVGRDRGFRALSFLPASRLSLNRVKAVRDPTSVTTREPTLVVDANAKPLGWADGRRPGHVSALGSTFDPEQDSLRLALDAALTSPVGVAVAVVDGRYAGVVSAEEILSQATESRAAVAQSMSVRGQSSAEGAISAAEPAGEAPGSRVAGEGTADTLAPAAESSRSEAPSDDTAADEGADNGRDHAGAHAVTEVAFAGDVPVDLAPASDEGSPEPAEKAEAAPTTQGQGTTETGNGAEVVPEETSTQTGATEDAPTEPQRSADLAHEPFTPQGRGSEEPGAAVEFDVAKTPWNPFRGSS